MPPRHVRLLAKHLSPIPGHSFYQVSTTVRLGPSRQCRFRCTANKIYPPAFRRAYNSRHPFRGNPSGLPVGRGKGRWRGWWHRGVLLGDEPPSHGGTKARCALPCPASAMARRCHGIGGRPGAAEIRRGGHAARRIRANAVEAQAETTSCLRHSRECHNASGQWLRADPWVGAARTATASPSDGRSEGRTLDLQ